MKLSMRRRLPLAAAIGLALGASACEAHFPGHHARAAIAENEGPWFVRAGAVQDLYANTGPHPLPLIVYLCTQPQGGGAPHVLLRMIGRAPIDIQGCQSVFLDLSGGERLEILNPNPFDVTGSYKLDLQARVR